MNAVERYKQEVEALFRKWKTKAPSDGIDHKSNVFIRDGVVCPEQWFSQEVRPLFLLKEAFHGEGDWDLISDHLLTSSKIRGGTWRRISVWTQGILNTTKDAILPYSQCNVETHYGNKHLKQIAVVNVRKSGGSSASDMDIINRYAYYDKAELFQEIELIDPTIIICGYTMSSLNIIMGQEIKSGTENDMQNAELFYTTEINQHKVIVLNYWHPSNRYPDLMNYYGLMGIYQQSLIRQDRI